MEEFHGHPEIEQAGKLLRCSHDAMATTFGLDISGEEEIYAGDVCRECWNEVDRVEKELSSYITFSDISRISRLEKGQRIKIGPIAFQCLQEAQKLYEATSGAFDVTMASARPAGAEQSFPIELDEENHAAGPTEEGVNIDLGGIGKGFCLDWVSRVLDLWSIENARMHAGTSTVLPRGTPLSQEEGWTVTLRHPDTSDTLGRLHMQGRAFSGSGAVAEQPHIIDPRTGKYTVPRRGAWALAPDATYADALSTAFTVMTEDEIRSFCKEYSNVTALLLSDDPQGDTLTAVGKEPRLDPL